jgi:hypothetical protein
MKEGELQSKLFHLFHDVATLEECLANCHIYFNWGIFSGGVLQACELGLALKVPVLLRLSPTRKDDENKYN